MFAGVVLGTAPPHGINHARRTKQQIQGNFNDATSRQFPDAPATRSALGTNILSAVLHAESKFSGVEVRLAACALKRFSGD